MHFLSYRIESRTPIRNLLFPFLSVLAVVSVVLWAIYSGCQWFYWHDYNAVRGLESLPQVQATNITGFDDGLRYKLVDAQVWLSQSQGKMISFPAPVVWSLPRGRHLPVQIAPYVFLGIGPDESWYQLDLGSDGVFSNLFPFKVESAKQIIERYDEIVATLDKMPNTGFHKSKDGVVYWYRISLSSLPDPGHEATLNQYWEAVAKRK